MALALATRRWVLSIDADEELDADLRQAITKVVTQSDGDARADAYYVRRKLVFMGRVMRFGKTQDAPLRLFRRGQGQFQGSVHEQIVMRAGSSVRYLAEGSLLHHSYDDLTDYFTKFNRYTTQVASRNASAGRGMSAARLVLRPWLEFVWRYFLRLGCLDGYPGYCYALVSSLYTFVKHAKLRELSGSK